LKTFALSDLVEHLRNSIRLALISSELLSIYKTDVEAFR